MFLKTVDTPSVARIVQELGWQKGETFMLLVSEKSNAEILKLIQFFNQENIPFFGGIFPGLIYKNEKREEGCIIKKFQTVAPPHLVRYIADKKLKGINDMENTSTEEKYTAITLVDGLTSNINFFLESLNNQIGSSVNFFGGGAGSLSLQQQPCVFSNEGFFQDAAIVAIIKKKGRLGVRHGWEQLAGPLIATKTKGNKILQLNWENAFEVYKKTVEKDAEIELSVDNFFETAKSYPFGIFRENLEDIVRDPISVDEKGHLLCVGEVPPNTVLYILKGETENLIRAAGQAMADCKKSGSKFLIEDTLVVDCISRTLFLEEWFPEELAAVRSQLEIKAEEQELQGILSLGEISSIGYGLLEFFNKTIVVSTLTSQT